MAAKMCPFTIRHSDKPLQPTQDPLCDFCAAELGR